MRAIRNTRAEKNVKANNKLAAIIVAGEESQALYQQEAGNIATLAGLDAKRTRVVGTLESKPTGHIALVVGAIQIYLPMADLVDAGEERLKLEKELNETQAQIDRLKDLLAGSFAEKAPAAVVHKERDRLAGFEQTAAKLRDQLAALSE